MEKDADRLDEDGFQDDDIDEEVKATRQSTAQHLWCLFEGAAVAIAQLYKERQQLGSNSVWPQFQESARAITALYQDGYDMHRKALELGIQWGQRKRTREVLAWARRRRRNLRRDDLIGYITNTKGKPSSPSRSEGHPFPPSAPPPHSPSSVEDQSSQAGPFDGGADGLCLDLDFGGFGFHSPPPPAGSQPSALQLPAFTFGSSWRRPSGGGASGGREGLSRDSAFARALATGRKRLANDDVVMDSPSPKRGRLT